MNEKNENFVNSLKENPIKAIEKVTGIDFPEEKIKGKIDEIVNKIKSDDSFANKFKNNPVETVEKFVGIDLPEEKINSFINAIKAKIKDLL